MRFSQVLDRAFLRGAGIAASEVRASPSYREQLKKLRSVNLPESPASSLNQGGLWRATELLNTLPEADAIRLASEVEEPPRPQPSIETDLLFLGRSLVEQAANRLPEHIKELAREWNIFSAREQLQICDEVVRTIVEDSRTIAEQLGPPTQRSRSEPGWVHDILGQSEASIFTRLDGPLNCLGRAEVALAFARLAGAPVIGAIPVQSRESSLHIGAGKAATAIERTLATGFELREGDRDFSAAYRRTAEIIEEMNDYFHYAVVIQLADGSWALLDPGRDTTAKMSLSFEIDRHAEMIKKYSPWLPGLTFRGHRGRSSQIYRKSLALEFEKYSQQVVHSIQLLQKQDQYIFADVVFAVARSGIPDILVSQLKLSEDEASILEGLLVGEFKQYQDSRFAESTQEDLYYVARISAVMMLAEILDPTNSEETLLPGPTNVAGLREILRLAPQLTFHNEVRKLQDSESQPDESYEFCDPEYFVGVAAISHLGYLRAREASNIDSILARHAADQHRLLHVAAAPLRAKLFPEGVKGLPLQAFRYLNRHPHKMPVSERLLKRLALIYKVKGVIE